VNRVCLDTSAYSHFKRGDAAVVEIITGAREVQVPVIVLGELRAGFRQGARADDNERELRRFLAEAAVRVLEVDDEVSSIYADLLVELRRAGTPVPTNDAWIAALAAREGSTVITYDDHFGAIDRIGARILRVPAGVAT
jgi:tRNA(fMet)-specific endonuclease VapC